MQINLSEHELYQTWAGLKTRCYNKKHKDYKNYGLRGIGISEEWKKSFKQFLADMGDRPEGTTLDRIDNDKDYSKENCRWSCNIEQANNKRTSHKLSAYGVTQTISEWARTLEVPKDRILRRIRLDWSDHDALFLKVSRTSYKKRK